MRNLEGLLLHYRVEGIDGVPQVTVLRAVPARQCLPSSIDHCLYTRRSRSRTSVPANHLWPIEDLHCATELHASWSQDTLDLVLSGLDYAQLEQQTTKLSGNSQ
jgi:hypothetical protein